MTRPMPGPHEHPWTSWYYACTACSGMWEHGDECIRLLKHLSDAECAAEYWRALCDVDRPLAAGRFIPSADWNRDVEEAATWRRFATYPHADLEGVTP